MKLVRQRGLRSNANMSCSDQRTGLRPCSMNDQPSILASSRARSCRVSVLDYRRDFHCTRIHPPKQKTHFDRPTSTSPCSNSSLVCSSCGRLWPSADPGPQEAAALDKVRNCQSSGPTGSSRSPLRAWMTEKRSSDCPGIRPPATWRRRRRRRQEAAERKRFAERTGESGRRRRPPPANAAASMPR